VRQVKTPLLRRCIYSAVTQAAAAWQVRRQPAGRRRAGAHAARRGAGDDKPRSGRVAELFVYDNFSRVPVEQAEAGDICALTGLADVSIGETICAREAPNPLPMIKARRGLREPWKGCARRTALCP